MAFDDISAADLAALIENEVIERRTIEYKKELPGPTDEPRREFLADVSSFANAGGGDLVFGIEEDNGKPLAFAPLAFEPDAEKLRWEALIRDGIQPRISGVRVRDVPVDGGYALLIRIPQSWGGPHAVVYKSSSFRFFSRSAAGKYPLDIVQLQDAFLLRAGLAQSIRAFRTDRLGQIVADQSPLTLHPRAKIVMHCIPLRSVSTTETYDLTAAQDPSLFWAMLDSPGDRRWNVDGLLAYSLNRDGVADAYSQLFRNGILECVDAYYLQDRRDTTYRPPWAPGHGLEERVIKVGVRSRRLLEQLGVEPPIVFFVSLLGVKNLAIVSGNVLSDERGHRVDRDAVLLPEILVAEYGGDLGRELRPIADAIWQASGWERSPNYDNEGNWSPPNRH